MRSGTRISTARLTNEEGYNRGCNVFYKVFIAIMLLLLVGLAAVGVAFLIKDYNRDQKAQPCVPVVTSRIDNSNDNAGGGDGGASDTNNGQCDTKRPDIELRTCSSNRQLLVIVVGDDKYDAPGLVALRDAVSGAGHQVVLIASSGDVSGSSSDIRQGSTEAPFFNVTQISNNTFAVSTYSEDTPATPATPAMVAAHIKTVVRDLLSLTRPIDIVLSGINNGLNAGYASIASGTVAAGLTAATVLEVPAVVLNAYNDGLGAYPSNLGGYTGFALSLLKSLICSPYAATHSGRLLPRGTVLNVQMPAVMPPVGIRLARTSRLFVLEALAAIASNFADDSFVFYGVPLVSIGPNSTLTVMYGEDPPTNDDYANADILLTRRGYATVTPLNVNFDAPPCETDTAYNILHRHVPVVRSCPSCTTLEYAQDYDTTVSAAAAEELAKTVSKTTAYAVKMSASGAVSASTTHQIAHKKLIPV